MCAFVFVLVFILPKTGFQDSAEPWLRISEQPLDKTGISWRVFFKVTPVQWWAKGKPPNPFSDFDNPPKQAK